MNIGLRPRTFFPILLCLLSTAVLAQPPMIYSRSVFNAARYMPVGIPAGAIARGSIFTLFGNRLGPTTPVTASGYPLSNTLGTVTMTLTQGSTTVSVLPLYVSPTQINAIMPSNAPLGAASLQVAVNGSKSNFTPVQVASSAFGIFTALGTGLGPGILQNFVTSASQPRNSPAITATPGEVITLWGTGLGAVNSDIVAPTAGFFFGLFGVVYGAVRIWLGTLRTEQDHFHGGAGMLIGLGRWIAMWMMRPKP